MSSSSLLPWAPWCRPTHWVFACRSANPDHHLSLQSKGYSRCGREGKKANWNKWHQNPKASDQMRQSRHVSHMLLNNKQMEATRDTFELNQNYPRTSNSNWIWSLPENLEFSECMWLEVTLSLRHFSKIKPLLQFAATDSTLKTQGKQDCAGSVLFSVHMKLRLVNPTSGT